MAEQKSATMFELTQTLNSLMELAGSDDPEEQEAFENTLEGIKYEIGLKADSYVRVINRLDAQAKECKEAADYLRYKAKHLQDNVDRMKETIKFAVEETPADAKGRKHIDGKAYSFSIVNNGGSLPIVYTVDVNDPAFPKEYKKLKPVEYVADTDKIRKELESGKKLPFAHLGERGTRLKIK